MEHTLLVLIIGALMIPGLAMAIIPGLPGLLYMLVVAVIYGAVDHFAHLSVGNLGILAAIAAAGMLLDLFSGIAGAKWGGAHWSSLVYGLAGLVVGSVAIPIPVIGSLAGLFFGILFVEWHRTSNIKKANKAALGSFAGSLVGMAGNVAAALAFLVLFIVFALA